MGTRRTRPKKRSDERSSFFNIFDPSRKYKNVPRFEAIFLVVKYEGGYSEIRFKILDVSTSKDRTAETWGRVESVDSSLVEIGKCHDGFCDSVTKNTFET